MLIRFLIPCLLAMIVVAPGLTKSAEYAHAQVLAHRLSVPDAVMEAAEGTALQYVRDNQGSLNVAAIAYQNAVPLCPSMPACNRNVVVTYAAVGQSGDTPIGNGTDESEQDVNAGIGEVRSKIKITATITEGTAATVTRSELLRLSRFPYDPFVKRVGVTQLATTDTAVSAASLVGCGAANTTACAPNAVQAMDDTHVHAAPVCTEQWDWSCTNAPPAPISDNYQTQTAPNVDQASANGWSR